MRNDVHAPKNLRPEDYDFVACGNFGTAEIDAYSPLAHSHKYLIDEGWRFADTSGGTGQGCQHCGAFLIYYAILKHIPSHTLLRVGETCLDNRFSLANAEFQKLRKAAKLNRERKRLRDKRDEFLDSPANALAYEWAKDQPAFDRDGYDESFEAKFVRYIDKYGEASQKFVSAILRSKARQEEWTRKRAEEAKTASPVVEGKITVTGEVISVKLQSNQFGERLVMTVKDDRGFKVWGSVPNSLALIDEDSDTLKGKRVRFTATVTKSDTDDTFGFYKRPTKAEVL